MATAARQDDSHGDETRTIQILRNGMLRHIGATPIQRLPALRYLAGFRCRDAAIALLTEMRALELADTAREIVATELATAADWYPTDPVGTNDGRAPSRSNGSPPRIEAGRCSVTTNAQVAAWGEPAGSAACSSAVGSGLHSNAERIQSKLLPLGCTWSTSRKHHTRTHWWRAPHRGISQVARS
ncbi:hypothetical protein [Kibdelosporangium phytohabitans]|uniref:hypothetical protein n=1 Tax=Kibdelosporangium phytohabitans TaxID=860235 RepID=UPI0012FCFC78|nr:hypothetical protein [Kibdelosporangium phytohabitans]MBE1470721.1 hypothetical protein [Kibdelosporangium phytohabitans]